MRNSPAYAIAWAAMATFGLIGIPRFLAILKDFASIENDFEGYKRLFTGGVLIAHSPYLLALLCAAFFRPRRKAFSTRGILGAIGASCVVASIFVSYFWAVGRTYPVSLQFIDLAGNTISGIPATVVHKIEGFTPATSPTRTTQVVLDNGVLTVDKTFREILTVTVHPAELAYARVTVLPMGGRYPRGPLQKIDMWWFLDPRGGTRETSAIGSRNWSFQNGTLTVPVPPATAPLKCPVPPYTDEDWQVVTGRR